LLNFSGLAAFGYECIPWYTGIQKNGRSDPKRKLNGKNIQFSDRVNRMDRINILNQKNPDNPVNPV